MIEGAVNAALQAVISLSVSGPTGQTRDIEAVIDTGYNGFLTVWPEVARELELPFVTSGHAVLADGSEAQFDIHRASVFWNDRPMDVDVHVFDTAPLAGMRLLEWHTLLVQVRDGGRVAIEAAG